MKKVRRIRISMETKQVLVIRSSRRIWCPECGEGAQMVTPEEAAGVSGVATRAIYRWLEEGKIHFCSSREGTPLTCLNSILRLKSG